MENNVNNKENNKENQIKQENPKNQDSQDGARGISSIKAKLTREVLMYLIFGVLTTLVGWIVYFAVMAGGRALFGIPSDDLSSVAYLGLYTAAQLLQWICAVLFAFFTNRKWVFTEGDKKGNIFFQLVKFSSGRVLTLALDYVITFFGGMALSKLLPALNSVALIGHEWNINDILAKLVAAVVVIVGNYFFSKFLVFKKKK